MRLAVWGFALALVLLAGCSTDREYKVTHDQMVDATVAAICDEANVKSADVKRSEEDVKDKGGRLTVLSAPYKRQSRIECKVDTREKHSAVPNLEVRIVTNDTFYTRHKEWEWRLHEVVERKLKAREHGAESKPTAMPRETPQLPPEREPQKLDIKPKL